MKYADARPLIKSGDILAWSHRGWRTFHDIKIQMVRFFTQSKYSHVGTAWVIGDRVFVLEAVQPLVRSFPLSKLLVDGCDWIPLNAPWRDATLTFAVWCVGDPYSQLQALQSFNGQPPVDKKWQCAELCRSIAELDGIDLGPRAVPSSVVDYAIIAGGSLHTIEAQP